MRLYPNAVGGFNEVELIVLRSSNLCRGTGCETMIACAAEVCFASARAPANRLAR
jgi:hypothetical protein